MKAKDITPKLNKCVGIGCSSIFKTDRGTFLIVGSIPAANELPRNVRKKLGKGEVAVEIPQGILASK